MKRLLSLTLALALTLSLAACAPAKPSVATPPQDTPAAPEKTPATMDKTKVVIYTARDENVFTLVKEKFEAEYPQYELDIMNMGAQAILERVRAEKANPQADFWWGGTQAAFETAAKEELLEAYTPSFDASIPALYKDSQSRWYGEILLPEVIMYNTDMLTAEQLPMDWDDLLKPEYKDKIVIRGVLASGTMRTIYCAMIYRQDATNPEKGYEWLAKLDANTKSYTDNPTNLYLALARQEGAISLWNLQDIMIQKMQNNQPFDYVLPTSGYPVLVDGVGVVKGAKNVQGATDFCEFLFREDIKLSLAEEMYQIPTQSDIPADKLPQWIRELKLDPMDMDWQVLAENEMIWMEHWDQNIKGRN